MAIWPQGYAALPVRFSFATLLYIFFSLFCCSPMHMLFFLWNMHMHSWVNTKFTCTNKMHGGGEKLGASPTPMGKVTRTQDHILLHIMSYLIMVNPELNIERCT
jgi:hypothetical protein